MGVLRRIQEQAARVLAGFIPVRSVRKRVRRRLLDRAHTARLAETLPVVNARYARHAEACRRKLADGECISVAFLVCDASMFSGESVFLRLRGDRRFKCEIVVAPRVTRGEAFLRETLAKTVSALTAKYPGAVRPLYDPATRQVGVLDADIVFSTVIYEDQTLAEFTTERLSLRSLVAVLYYGYGGLFRTNERKTPCLPNIVFAWRYFVSNEATRRMSLARNPLLARRIVTVGYAKMDRLAEELSKTAGVPHPPTVIISPHHSIERGTDGLMLSTFLKNEGLFLRLPKLFPEIRFVFRPHPLLFARLRTDRWWGEERTARWEHEMESNANVEFQRGGDYFAAFAASDALIHDCGSFLAEYFYTGRPQCYLLEGERTLEQFLPFSRDLLAQVTTATDEAAVLAFLREVVLGGDDPRRAERAAFAKSQVCVNYPDATGGVVAAVLRGIEKGED